MVKMELPVVGLSPVSVGHVTSRPLQPFLTVSNTADYICNGQCLYRVALY